LTVLGEYVLPDGGRAWTGRLVRALGAVGVAEKAARQAVARSAEAGLLCADREGRRTRWRLTPAATALLTEGTGRIYSFGLAEPEWDGRWLLLFTSVPEVNRQLRYRLQNRLAWAGFAPLAPGTWLSPWVDREPAARAALAELALPDGQPSFVGELGGGADARDLVRRSWRLDRVEADYERFVTVHERAEPGDDEGAFAALTLLVHDWRRFPAADPGLPAGLLPEPWSGKHAADLFHSLHRAWAPAARRWWAQDA
jgi:phenylacetic acid degradation operon negative regulatory protein